MGRSSKNSAVACPPSHELTDTIIRSTAEELKDRPTRRFIFESRFGEARPTGRVRGRFARNAT